MPKFFAANDGLQFAMVAGEASGDLLASLLLQGARQRWPHLQARGIGGAQMEAQGFVAQWPSEALAVHGYSFEVLRRVAGIWQIRNELRQQLLARKPDLFVGVDAPDFNLGLEEDLRSAGVRTVHFVSPSIWAWRPERVHKIRRAADHVLCIFPFEPDLLARHGISSTYVGHPLANTLPMEPDQAGARRALGLPEQGEVLALLPGSRGSEIQYLAPRFLDAAKLLQKQRPGLQCVLPAVPAQYQRVRQLVREQGMEGQLQVVKGQSHAVLAACDVTLIASGTATLEAALFKRPMVISYAMHPVSALLMRRKQLQPWVGLPNILCRDFVVPELLQDQATPRALAAAMSDWLDQPARVAAVRARFTELHHVLQRDTARLATDAIAQVLSR
ncbi:lipid-A-disaccharide synthase [Brachymonas denitrificans]|uniref:lipid-A-disaccharide synthase n=1 Tax=Brachymonas denitrificans TaxID=28220 RepID=UPI0020219489|nr:lipid-A-disaccharide synthase [Brachymonas denitrificans]